MTIACIYFYNFLSWTTKSEQIASKQPFCCQDIKSSSAFVVSVNAITHSSIYDNKVVIAKLNEIAVF